MHEQTTLPDGLRVISETMPAVRSVAVGVFVGVGARDERPQEAGVTHLIEHLLFKGSKRFDQVEIARVSDRLGSELNAFTTRESTVVHVRVLDEHLPLALDVMCDMAAHPRFEADALESEREVVLEEIAMIEDDPSDLVHDLAARCVFGDHELGRPVIGSAATVRALTNAEIGAYHASRYGAGNVVVAAAGNVEHDAFRALVAERLELGAATRARAHDAGDRRRPAALPGARHRAVPRLPLGSGPAARRRAPLRARAARPRARRRGLVAPRAGDPRAARDGLQRLQLHLELRRRRSARHLRGHARRERGGVRRDRARPRSPTCARAGSRPTSSSVPRRASRGACCSRSSRRPRACRGSDARC